MRLRAALVLAAAAALSVTLPACGSDEPAREKNDPALSPERYRQIDRIYRAALELDRDRADRIPPRAVARFTRACRALDRRDPLLAAGAATCAPTLAFVRQARELEKGLGCAEKRACARAMRRLVRPIGRIIVAGRSSDRVVAREVSDLACQTALSSPPGYLQTFEHLRSALGGLADILEADSPDPASVASALSEAGAAMEELDRLDKRFSARSLYDRFRSGCGPS